ncbi:MAG: ATP-binding cassette domain-containing protein, partial [Spirochaetaceae bacterium]|nr:ATP-binding cassette domain-containing protein [Spirochaetaceae bacterium]
MNRTPWNTGPVAFAYPEGPTILSLTNLQLSPGTITVIAGENGSGKTTLLKILSGLLHIRRAVGDELRTFRTHSSYLHQHPYLFRGSVLRNLRLASPQAGDSDITRALDSVGLAGYAQRNVKKLSGGEIKRVALARLFLSDRQILLLDEPAAHVDAISIRKIEECCRGLADRGRTLIVTSHRGGFGYRVADTLVDLEDGSVRTSSVNILRGSVSEEKESFLSFESRGVRFRVPHRDGSFQVAVLAGEDIILSKQPLESSARNCLKGTIRRLDETGDDGIRAS